MPTIFKSLHNGCSVEFTPGFKLLIGAKPANLLPYTVWLLTDSSNFEIHLEEVLFSGIWVGMTYPIWASLSATTRSRLDARIFQSYNQPWNMPCGWTVYPVCSGNSVGGSNWLFTNDGVRLLVASQTCLPFFQPPEMIPNLSHLLRINTIPESVNLVSTFVAIMNAVKDEQPVIWVTLNSDRMKIILHACFEWLHADFQIYIQKNISVWDDLIKKGKIVICKKMSQVPHNAHRVFTDISDTELVYSKCSYEAKFVSETEICIETTDGTDPRTDPQIELDPPSVLDRYSTRFDDISVDNNILTIPSICSKLEFSNSKLISVKGDPNYFAELIHISNT